MTLWIIYHQKFRLRKTYILEMLRQKSAIMLNTTFTESSQSLSFAKM